MPKLLTTPFATSGLKNDVPTTTGTSPNSATYNSGFPDITMQPFANGGLAPSGKDFNGVLYDITGNIVYQTQGGRYKFDGTYATSIGGYPLGAILLLNDGVTDVVSTVANNLTDPNVSMTGWELRQKDSGILTWSGRTQESKNKDQISILDFTKTGETWESTIQAADTYCHTYNKVLYFPNGVYKCANGIIKRAEWRGEQMCQIGVFPLYDDKVDMIGDKTGLRGTVLLFTGSGSVSYTTARTDNFATMRYAVMNVGRETSGDIARGMSDMSIIADFDFRDNGGVLTTPLNDNRADYEVGLLLVNSEQSIFNKVCVGGYWSKAGTVHFGQDPDDTHFHDVRTMGNIGLAIIGDDTGTNSGFNGYGMIISANDHHSRYTGTGEDWGECALYIDVSSSGVGSRNGINFFGGSISTKVNTPAKYDRCGDVGFFGTKWENADQAGSTQAGGPKKQIGTQYTGDIAFVGCRFTSDQIRVAGGLLNTAVNCTVKIMGGSVTNGFEYWRGKIGYRVSGTVNQTNIQLTSDPTLSTTGIVLRRTASDNLLRILADNTEVFRIGANGTAFQRNDVSTLTVSGGAITVSRNWHKLSGGTTTLTTINGGVLGQRLILNAATSSDQITLQDGGGNLRLNGNFVTTNGQNYIELLFDGTNWCELSRSLNS